MYKIGQNRIVLADIHGMIVEEVRTIKSTGGVNLLI